MSKSYKNPEFMMGEEARPLRLLSEYIEPRARLASYGVQRALIFWGSARLRPMGTSPVHVSVDYYAQARELAARMAQWTMDNHADDEHYYICTGGGPGIMEAANRGAADINRELSLGFGISLPHEQDNNDYINRNLSFEFHYFFMRKFWFMNIAEALVVFPGGFGTMDELFEMLTLMQTGKSEPIPVVLFGKHFWERLINFDVFVDLGLIAEKDRSLVHMATDVDDASGFLINALEPPQAKIGIQPAS